MSKLENNTLELQAILDAVNSLPEAGEGGGEPTLQEKTITPTKSVQEVIPDTGYDGLSKVNVGAIPEEYIVPSGTLDITANGSYDVTEKESVVVSIENAPTLQEKTVSPTTAQQQVTPDSGFDGLSKVTVNAMPTAEQATPVIEIEETGRIVAYAEQAAGYVSAGAKEVAEQLPVQAAKTITPTTSSQTAVESGVFSTGKVTVAPIPSNYEDVTTETNAYTSKLETLGTAITALEEELQGKAAGGGGNVETCTVTIMSTGSHGYIVDYLVTRYINGSIVSEFAEIDTQQIILENVIKGSSLVVGLDDLAHYYQIENATTQIVKAGAGAERILYLTAGS